MTPLLVALDGMLTLLAGAAVCGLVGAHVTLMERVAAGAVLGVVLSSAATFVLALFA
ncbi:MAG: hypothetical protein JOY68_07300, partial [Candidatus Dormibacteraeota bacterium]|nr:hypothetical protein [Candidatus Dormibacteraeota bacterium]